MSDGFILSSSIRDQGRNSTQLVFQGRLAGGGRFRWTVTRPRLCFFVERQAPDLPGAVQRRPLELRTLRGLPVDCLYFQSSLDLARARRQAETQGVQTYESDVSAPARHLMERNVRGGIRFLDPPVSRTSGLLDFQDGRVESSDFTPDLRLLSLDVECTPKQGLFSISLYGDGIGNGNGHGNGSGNTPGEKYSRVLLLEPGHPPGTPREGYEAFPDERALLTAFLDAVRAYDPDVLIGWNVINFDLRYLAERCRRAGLSLDLGIDGPADLIEPEGASAYGRFGSNWLARIPGRSVLDGINMLKAAFVPVEGYSLGAVAAEILGQKKLIELEGEEKMAEIERRFREDKPALARYNLQDSVLVHDIFAKLSLSQLAVRKTQLTGLALDRMGGSVAALDFLYLPRLHRAGFVADTGNRAPADEGVPGGLVLEGEPGIHRNVLVLDFKSLYPSIIRTFLVDPLAAAAGQHGLAESGNAPVTWIRGPSGPPFAKEWAILPGIVESLMDARESAKETGDKALSQAVKIIMNSFYGVLGNPGCRFFHPDLAGTITRTGQWILLEAKRYLESLGYRVLYGDTDSLFVHAPKAEDLDSLRAIGAGLAASLNQDLARVLLEKFAVESRMTIQFEKIFLRFFMPALRKEDRGSKKRYAGLLANGSLHFTGLESARSDWTRLAKDFQSEILTLVFKQEKVDDRGPLEALVREWNRRLLAGGFDDRLVYSKGLSKDPDDYTGNAPPHVRAARMLDKREGRMIRYVMTTEGPEPVQKLSGAKPDYKHYAEKQLAPIADMVLRFHGTDFGTVTLEARQLSIF
ncbi:MAG TPA: DNA polymerase II [Fibrobacteria bacterium]|nr:DNA polymerase II [Fibrobacteria bacterium]